MSRLIGSTIVQVISFCCGLFIAFLLMSYSDSLASVHKRLAYKTDIPYADQVPNHSKVYKWSGNRWEQLVNFCTWMQFPDCVMLKTKNGATPIFHHDPKNDYTSNMLKSTGMKEPETIEAILDYMAHDTTITFLDVGSHVGSIALQIAKAGFKIVTVDPLPENIGRLCKSVETGNFVDNFTILFTPVSNEHKTVSFIRQWNIGATKVKVMTSEDDAPSTDTPSCKLPPLLSKTATLDDMLPFIKSHKVFIKIDVESHEYFVIKGGENLFKTREVMGIFMEWIHVKKTTEATQLISLINELGFIAYNLGKSGKPLENKYYMNWPLDIIWKRKL